LPSSGELEHIVDAGIDLANPPVGCRFYPRCVFRQKLCEEVYPELREIREGHLVSCHLAEQLLARASAWLSVKMCAPVYACPDTEPVRNLKAESRLQEGPFYRGSAYCIR
jgi:hypothetical protein